jgi:hypothetical protein
MIIDHAHKAIGHFGQFKTSLYVMQYYWWPNMAKDIDVFCDSATPVRHRRLVIKGLAAFCIHCRSPKDPGSW